MASESKSVVTVILRGPDDWFEWINQVANYARQLDLWHYVDPDGVIVNPPLPTKPERPVAP